MNAALLWIGYYQRHQKTNNYGNSLCLKKNQSAQNGCVLGVVKEPLKAHLEEDLLRVHVQSVQRRIKRNRTFGLKTVHSDNLHSCENELLKTEAHFLFHFFQSSNSKRGGIAHTIYISFCHIRYVFMRFPVPVMIRKYVVEKRIFEYNTPII
jgi:hypothetical protein